MPIVTAHLRTPKILHRQVKDDSESSNIRKGFTLNLTTTDYSSNAESINVHRQN